MPTVLEVRERILEHALGQFLSRGFSKVTLDEFSSDLGISKKTLYKHYPSKEELLRASLHSMMRSAGWELERIVSSDRPFVEKLALTMLAMGRYLGRIRREALVDLQRFTPSIWKELDQFRQQQILSRLGRMIAQARDDRILRPEVNEQIIIYMLESSVQGIVNPSVLSRHAFSAEDAVRSIFTILFHGALTEEARKEFSVFEKPTPT